MTSTGFADSTWNVSLWSRVTPKLLAGGQLGLWIQSSGKQSRLEIDIWKLSGCRWYLVVGLDSPRERE